MASQEQAASTRQPPDKDKLTLPTSTFTLPSKPTSQVQDVTAKLLDKNTSVPGIGNIKLAVEADQPSKLIIHIGQRHEVRTKLLVKAMETEKGRPLTNEELTKVEAVGVMSARRSAVCQDEIVSALKYLKEQLGIDKYHMEGLTTDVKTDWWDTQKAMMKQNYPVILSRIKQYEGNIEEVDKILNSTEKPTGAKLMAYELVRARNEVELAEHQHMLNLMPSMEKAYAQGIIPDILPFCSRELTEAGLRRVTGEESGSVHALNDSREDYSVETVLKTYDKGDVSVVLYGSNHDMSNNVREWNKNNPDKQANLIVMTPKVLLKKEDKAKNAQDTEALYAELAQRKSILATYPEKIKEVRAKELGVPNK